jgi:hypothetical protein
MLSMLLLWPKYFPLNPFEISILRVGCIGSHSGVSRLLSFSFGSLVNIFR